MSLPADAISGRPSHDSIPDVQPNPAKDVTYLGHTYSLQYLSPALRNDKAIVMAAIKNDGKTNSNSSN